jgi:hypothetical protein
LEGLWTCRSGDCVKMTVNTQVGFTLFIGHEGP